MQASPQGVVSLNSSPTASQDHGTGRSALPFQGGPLPFLPLLPYPEESKFNLAGPVWKLHMLHAAGSGKNTQIYWLKKAEIFPPPCIWPLRFYLVLNSRGKEKGTIYHTLKKNHSVFFRAVLGS